MDIAERIDGLSSAAPAARRQAAEQLALDPDVAAAVSLVGACGDSDEQVREWAVSALEQMGAPDADDADALERLLAADQADVRYWSATLLGRLGEAAGSAVGSLSRALVADEVPAVRQRAAWALGRMGRAAAAARESLTQAASSGDARLARLAGEALKTIGEGRNG